MVASERVVVDLWEAMDARDWLRAEQRLHPDVVIEWPQSGERIRGRANFVALNRNYPGDWSLQVERVVSVGDAVAVHVRIPIDERVEHCAGFYDVADGVIVRGTELWGEPFPAPKWREAWVERA